MHLCLNHTESSWCKMDSFQIYSIKNTKSYLLDVID